MFYRVTDTWVPLVSGPGFGPELFWAEFWAEFKSDLIQIFILGLNFKINLSEFWTEF